MSVDVYKSVTDQILAALERGTVPWRNPILGRKAAGLPRNLESGKTYRGTNVFLLALVAWSEGYESPHWLTFRQARARGGNVKKGEKSTIVIFWKQLTIEDAETKATKIVPMLRYYRVFNIEQCDGIVAPVAVAPVPPTPFSPIEEAEKIVTGYHGPRVTHGGSVASYKPLLDEIRIPEPGRFVTAEDYYATFFHEMIHSTGHSSRLNRGIDSNLAPFGSPDYSREELVAEMGAAFLGARAGIVPSIIENTAAYIQGWIKQLRDDKRLVVQAGGNAQKAADFVLGTTEPAGE